MKDITKAAQTYVGLSHCDRCKFYLHCNLDRMEACRDTSIRAFIAGVKWAKKQIKEGTK